MQLATCRLSVSGTSGDKWTLNVLAETPNVETHVSCVGYANPVECRLAPVENSPVSFLQTRWAILPVGICASSVSARGLREGSNG